MSLVIICLWILVGFGALGSLRILLDEADWGKLNTHWSIIPGIVSFGPVSFIPIFFILFIWAIND